MYEVYEKNRMHHTSSLCYNTCICCPGFRVQWSRALANHIGWGKSSFVVAWRHQAAYSKHSQQSKQSMDVYYGDVYMYRPVKNIAYRCRDGDPDPEPRRVCCRWSWQSWEGRILKNFAQRETGKKISIFTFQWLPTVEENVAIVRKNRLEQVFPSFHRHVVSLTIKFVQGHFSKFNELRQTSTEDGSLQVTMARWTATLTFLSRLSSLWPWMRVPASESSKDAIGSRKNACLHRST